LIGQGRDRDRVAVTTDKHTHTPSPPPQPSPSPSSSSPSWCSPSLTASISLGVPEHRCVPVYRYHRVGLDRKHPFGQDLKPPCARSCSPSFQLGFSRRHDTTRYDTRRHETTPGIHCRSPLLPAPVRVGFNYPPGSAISFALLFLLTFPAITTLLPPPPPPNRHSQSSRKIALEIGFDQLSSRHPVLSL
jgi:hypothetical protein